MTTAEIDATFHALGLGTDEQRKAMRFDELDQQDGFAVQTFIGTNTSYLPEPGDGEQKCQA